MFDFSPERAAYHRLMLLAGMPEEYDREMDVALEQEPELGPLVLALALCLSDRRRTIAVLTEYSMDHPPETRTVFDWVVAELRQRYEQGNLTLQQTIEAMYCISDCQAPSFEEPWYDLRLPTYAYEDVEPGFYPLEAFQRDFDNWLRHGTQTQFYRCGPGRESL